METSPYAKLQAYLAFMQQRFNLQICIKDFCGFIPINPQLDEALRPYLSHTSPYCMHIKQDRQQYHQCLSMMRAIYEKCETKKQTFFGVCHAGLGEYVTPIFSKDVLIGTVNAGFFCASETRAKRRVQAVCSRAGMDDTIALALWQESISQPALDKDDIIPMMEIVAEYLGRTYESIQPTYSHTIGRKRFDSSEDTILSHATEYIHQNFASHIAMAELADFCHCSASYLSHIFKRRMGININTYINKVRIETSKSFLTETNRSIAEISSLVGFGDPNYYSRVFAQLVSFPPLEYRRRYRKPASSST